MSKAPLHALQGFVSAARTRNLSRAAETMNLTVSALSHQMRALEERLGLTLLVRGPRGISLTAEGERLFEAVAPQLDAIERALKPARVRNQDALTLTMMPRVASAWLVPRLPRFVAAHPYLQLNIQSTVELVDFERDGVDAALRFGPGTWPGLQAEHLFDEWIQPVASPELIERVGWTGAGELAELPLLGASGGRWAAWFAQFGGDPPRRYVANFTDSEALLRAAMEGLGVALAPLMLSGPMLEQGKLVPLLEQRQRSNFAHYLVYPARANQGTALRAFRTWVKEEAREYQAQEAAAEATPERGRK